MSKELSASEKLGRKLNGKRRSWPKDRVLRLHRAIRWLKRAEQLVEEKDDDLAFITLWISLNACTSTEESRGTSYIKEFNGYLAKLVELDRERLIYNILWLNFSNFVRALINNKFVYGPFWDSLRNDDDEWKESFTKSKEDANRALESQEVTKLVAVVVDRLYVLRNQLIHGGATHGSSKNRGQVVDGRRLLTALVPVFLNLMFDDSVDWGRPQFPLVQDD